MIRLIQTLVLMLAGSVFCAQAQNIRLVALDGNDSGNTCTITPCRTVGRAIDVAVSGDIIDIGPGEFPGAWTLDKSLTIRGAGQDNVTVLLGSMGNAIFGRVFTIDGTDLEIEISDLVIRAGSVSGGEGGGVRIQGSTLSMNNVTLSHNRARSGGGIHAAESSLELNNVNFNDNIAAGVAREGGFGGGLFASSSSIAMENVFFVGNRVTEAIKGGSCGGGMRTFQGTAMLRSVYFIDNEASGGSGGGLCSMSTPGTLVDVEFEGNLATPQSSDPRFGGRGGGMFHQAFSENSPSLNNVRFIDNGARIAGGGLAVDGTVANLELVDVEFTDNRAQQGGGMHNRIGVPVLNRVTFSNNQAIGGVGTSSEGDGGSVPQGDFSILRGGGLYIDGGAPVLNDVTFSGNSTRFAGGGIYSEHGSPILNKVNFINNVAQVAGGHSGGMYSRGGEPVLVDVNFRGNIAEGAGGGMTSEDSSPILTNVSFVGNTGQAGGGMHNLNSSPVITNAIFSGNLAKCFFGTPGNCNGRGGGMFNQNSAPRLINVTFSGNRAEGDGGAAGGAMFNTDETAPIDTPVIRNTIFWNNQDDSGVGTSGASISLGGAAPVPIINFSLLQGAFPSGDGNLDGTDPANDPLFLNMPNPEGTPTLAGNLRLRPESLVIDVGNNTFVAGIDTDLDGNPRIIGGTVDLGAYEFTGEIDDVIFRDRFDSP